MKIYVLKYQFYVASAPPLPFNLEYFSTEDLLFKRLERLQHNARALNLSVSYDTDILNVDRFVE